MNKTASPQNFDKLQRKKIKELDTLFHLSMFVLTVHFTIKLIETSPFEIGNFNLLVIPDKAFLN